MWKCHNTRQLIIATEGRAKLEHKIWCDGTIPLDHDTILRDPLNATQRISVTLLTRIYATAAQSKRKRKQYFSPYEIISTVALLLICQNCSMQLKYFKHKPHEILLNSAVWISAFNNQISSILNSISMHLAKTQALQMILKLSNTNIYLRNC